MDADQDFIIFWGGFDNFFKLKNLRWPIFCRILLLSFFISLINNRLRDATSAPHPAATLILAAVGVR